MAKNGLASFLLGRPFLATAEDQFLLETGVFVGTVKHLGQENREQLIVEAISKEALTTSEIEGEILDRKCAVLDP